MEINFELAKKLITEQFPQWKELPISPVSHSGWDNRTFHLGQDMVIRLPSAVEYEPQILKECLWLPKLARQVSFKIPKPMGLGYPSKIYPWHWSINTWIDGSSLNQEPNVDLKQLAKDLAQFLKEFEDADANNGPEAGKHNFYRGASLTHYDHEMQEAIPKIKNKEQREIAEKLWEEATSSEWINPPVWVHGDIATGNLLIKDGGLEAVRGFGQQITILAGGILCE
jgi:aminoglycoside phosphotransferase (APT) family kinase protein